MTNYVAFAKENKLRLALLLWGTLTTYEHPLTQGRSANLVLLKQGADDLYGQWKICELKIMGLVRPATLIGKFGITRDTVEPFGLKSEYFYDQMQFATGMAHVFNYYFIDDVVAFFAGLVHEACK